MNIYLGELVSGRKNNFDFLRFLAASLVVFSHAFLLYKDSNIIEPLNVFTKGQITFGTLAVRVFFIISGFLIYQSFDRTKNVVSFMKARVLRIIPGLALLSLLTVFVLGPLVTSGSMTDYFKNSSTYKYLFTILLYFKFERLPGVFTNNVASGAVNGSLWTLQFEFMFYIAIAVLGVLKLLKKQLVMIMFIGTMLLSVIHLDILNPLKFTIDFFKYFSAGMLIYAWRDKLPIKGYMAIISGIALLLSGIFGRLDIVFPMFGSYLIIYLAYSSHIKLYTFSKYGDFSYGIYIFAFPIQQMVIQLSGGKMSPFANFFISYPIIVLIAAVSWHVVEKNFLKLKNFKIGRSEGSRAKNIAQSM